MSSKKKKTASLSRYTAKRNFAVTPEPKHGGKSTRGAPQFVIQKHWASRLHYDLRLELDGTMKSWAVPKGPSFDPQDKRMAIHVEDHPISYNEFEGEIPDKQYGAGKVIIWDKGTWTPVGDAHEGYRKGDFKFELSGHKLHGRWVLVRIKNRRSNQDAWLLIKERDEFARPAVEFSVTDEMPDSVAKLAKAKPIPKVAARGKRAATKRISVAKLEGATPRSLPTKLSPTLATLVDEAPADRAGWIYEVKFDGYRILARVDSKGVRLVTRNGHDWTHKLDHLRDSIASLSLEPCWLDGEIVMLNANGSSSFQQLQNAFESERTQDIALYLFDLPYYGGYDLTAVSLTDRRDLLKSVLGSAPAQIRFSDSFDAAPEDLLASACKMGLEGIIGKRRKSRYSHRRSPDWIKLKCDHRQEFVIGGWTDPQGSRAGLGSLLLGVHDEGGGLRYVGKVGTGFNEKSLTDLSAKLERLGVTKNPFTTPVGQKTGVHWVKPSLVAEVTFSEWTGGSHLRHPVFHALRTDKPAKAIVRERAAASPAGPKISNPERIIDSSSGVRKVDLVRYYGLVGELMMQHLKARPVSLVKAPRGIDHAMFFQKHSEKHQMEGVRQLDPKLDPDHPPYLEITAPIGLLSAAQMNVIEFHTWNAVKSKIMKPDRMIFDLDPGEGTPWSSVRDGAELMRGFLESLGLVAFLKTSGGKGLHVVVPIQPHFGWDDVKSFSQAIVVHVARTLPKLFVAKSGPKNRVGKVFIDYLRNGFGSTTVCAWSARARPGFGISVPLHWSELSKLKSGAQWTVKNAHERLAVGNDPWAAYRKSAKSLKSAMRILKFDPPK